MKEAYNFADFTNSFRPAIRLTYETQARHSHKNQRGGYKQSRRQFAYGQFNWLLKTAVMQLEV